MKYVVPALITLFSASMCIASAFANSFSTTSLDEMVITGTRTEARLDESPGNISLLNSDQLERVSAVHIQQALAQVPGVSLQRGNGQESLPGIRSAVLTGAGACGSVLILEEAIPVRGPGFCNVNELFDTHFEQAGRIEVVRGPSTAFFGSNSLTGSVNISLPLDTADKVSLEFGENNFLRAKGTAGYVTTENGAGRFFATFSHDGGYRDDSGYDQQKLSWRHKQSFGDWQLNAGFTATHLDQETAGFITGRDSYLDRTLARQNLNSEAFRETSSFRVWTRLSKQLNNHRIQVTPFIRVTDMDFLLHFLPGDPLEKNQQKGFGWQSSLTTQASDSLSWAIGLDADLSQGELTQIQEQPTRGSAFLIETIPTGVHYDYQVNAIQLGIFGHLNWQINDQWDLLAGLRAERLEYDYDNRTLTGRTRDDGTECGFGGCRYSRPADRDDSFDHLSPKLELAFRPNDRVKLYAALANSFRAPQATELYRLQRAQQVANLNVVESTNVEFGGFYTKENLELSISVYQAKQRNVIIRDSDFFNVDGNRIDSKGVEFSALHRLNNQWSWRLAGSASEHEYASDQISGGININGNEVDTAPKLSANAFLNWQPQSAFSAELQLQHVSEYFLDPENLRDYPGHTLLNLRASYQLSQRWQTSLRVLNIADRNYAERADFTSFTNERYFPGEPRSLFISFEYQFK